MYDQTDDDLPTPRENAGELSAGGFYSRTEGRPEESTIRVSGGERDFEPNVSLTLKSGGLIESSLCVGLDAETARDLAEELRSQAAYAERYAEHRRQEEADTDG